MIIYHSFASNFLILPKICDFTKDKFQLLCNIIKYCNTEKLEYDNYLTISVFKSQ